MIRRASVQRSRRFPLFSPAPSVPFVSRFFWFVIAMAIILGIITWAGQARAMDADGNRVVIGGRPAGCPHAYCGCGLRKFLGIDDARLNLAWNWARMFRRTHATAGAVAVRRHHVMLLVSQIAGTVYLVRDYNGGRHLSYLHERDVGRGYVFVDPSARVTMQ